MAAPGLLSHTIYYPADVASFPPGEKLPVLVWGNGGCRNDGRAFLGTLTKIASHGYLVVSGGVYEQRPGLEPLRGTDLIAGIDWAERANTADGPLKGRIDTSKVAAMGQSCGGLMVIEAAHDPRLDTIGVINSGMLNDLAGATLTTATKETLRTYHTPALYLNGGENDAAYVNANDDFERIDNVPVFYGVMTGAGHIATHRHRNGGVFAEVMTAWLDWRLKGDATAGRMFSGPDCGLCRNPAWVVRRKGAL
jgi:dienelactone hydrolase